MIYRELGDSGIEVSAVAFGAWAIGGWMWGGSDDAHALEAIRAGVDQGITLFDTAPIYGYGHSEELLGRALAGRRNRVVLATKCGMVWDREEGTFFFHSDENGVSMRPATKKIYRNLRPASIRAELEQSLRRLRTEHVDLYQTHWQDKTTPIEETMAELLKLKDEGKVRAIGACNANVDELKAYGRIASDQEKFSLLDRQLVEKGQADYCREQGIGILPYSPLANGLLTGKIKPDRQYGPGDLRRSNPRFTPANVEKLLAMLEQLRPLAAEHRATLAQLVIAWTIAQPGVTAALCGARNAAQAAENAQAAAVTLTPQEIDSIGQTVHN
jgi:aryl-alcohol dehydrogenase-like predicted oxidoreductase